MKSLSLVSNYIVSTSSFVPVHSIGLVFRIFFLLIHPFVFCDRYRANRNEIIRNIGNGAAGGRLLALLPITLANESIHVNFISDFLTAFPIHIFFFQSALHKGQSEPFNLRELVDLSIAFSNVPHSKRTYCALLCWAAHKGKTDPCLDELSIDTYFRFIHSTNCCVQCGRCMPSVGPFPMHITLLQMIYYF